MKAPVLTRVGKRLLDYALENPVKALSATVLAYGIAVLFAYFVHIRFLPDVDLEAATTLLYAAALMGSLLTGYIAFTLVMPGLLLAAGRDGRADITDRHVWLVAVLSSVIWALILSGLLLGAPKWLWWTASSVTLGVVAVAIIRAHIVESHGGPSAWWRRRYLWVLASTAACLFMMTLPVAFILMLGQHGDIRYANTVRGGLTLVFVTIVLALMAGSLGTLEARQRWVAALLLAPLMLVALCIVMGSFSAISVIVVNRLGLGEQRAVRAVVSGKTCRHINLALGQVICREGPEDEPSAICPAVLRSRIGSQVLLEFGAMSVEANDGRAALEWQSLQPEPDKPARFRRVVLDKGLLLAWSEIDMSVAPSSTASAPSAPVLASWLKATDAATGIANQPDALRTVLHQVCELVPRAAETPASASIPASAPLPPPPKASAAVAGHGNSAKPNLRPGK